MQMRMIFGIISVFIYSHIWAGDATHVVYQSQDQYVSETFTDVMPASSTLWPDATLRQDLTAVLGHKPSLRFKYWGAGDKTVWILDEIGKDRPITAGIVINQNQIEDVRVLVFRESRGWEIKHDFFTRQFSNLFLDEGHDLSGQIDNITGATLSVKAMTRMAQAALLLHEHAQQEAYGLAHAR